MDQKTPTRKIEVLICPDTPQRPRQFQIAREFKTPPRRLFPECPGAPRKQQPAQDHIISMKQPFRQPVFD